MTTFSTRQRSNPLRLASVVARVSPDLRQAARQLDDVVIEGLDGRNRRDRLRRRCSGQSVLSGSDLVQGCLPAALQFRGNAAIVGIDAVELPLSKRRLIVTPLELLLGTLSHRLICLAPSAARPGQRISQLGPVQRGTRAPRQHPHEER